jgi:Glycosyltransferase family 87
VQSALIMPSLFHLLTMARKTHPELLARAKTILHAVLSLHAAFWVLWLFYAFGFAPSLPERDWFLLREVAKSFVAGDWHSLYLDREVSAGTLFFRYPPFVLYLIAPLALLPPLGAYALVCVVQLIAAISMLLLLFRIRKPNEPDLNISAVFGSAAMCHLIVSGQNTGLLALVIAAAAFFWALGRNVLAGSCIGLLACKPNWLPVFGLAAIWRGGLRAGAASALTVAALILSTVPLGAGVWRDFFAVTTRTGEIETRLLAYKEITLLAALKTIFGWGALTKVVWGFALAGLTALVIRALRDARPIGRSIALLTLLAVVANPYAHFYDGFVLAVPGTLWYAHRNAYSSRAWWIICAWIAAYWLWDMAVFYYKPLVPGLADPRLSAAGILLTGWLVSEALACPPESSDGR